MTVFAPLTRDWDDLIEILEDDIKTKLIQIKPPMVLPIGYQVVKTSKFLEIVSKWFIALAETKSWETSYMTGYKS
jgi:hypothetical protein